MDELTNAPCCPWCGEKMAPAAYETKHEGWVGYYVCPECDAESPYVYNCTSWEDAIKNAYGKAMDRCS